MRKEIGFDKSIPYHVVTRTIDGRKVFNKEEDCLRLIFYFYVARIGSPAYNLSSKDVIKAAQALLEGEEIPKKLLIVEHKPLVDVLSFNEVINHIHLILIRSTENGIPKYMQKWKTAFAMHYNLKYGRRGNLFERPNKIIPIKTNFQLEAVLNYVNLKNTLDVFQPGWREKSLKNWKDAFKFLEKYQFSSFPDLFGNRNSKILASRETLEKYLGKEITQNKKEYINFIKDYLNKKFIQYYPFFLEES